MNHTLCGSWVVHATCNCTAMYRLAVFFSLSSLPPSLLSSLSLQSLTQAEPMQQKQIIGEHLYRQIYTMHPDLSGKITGTVTACITDLKCLKHTLYTCVNKCWESNKNYSFNCILPLIPFLSLPFSSPSSPGMLLEMDNSELLHMLEVPESLKSKVEEAVTVLR